MELYNGLRSQITDFFIIHDSGNPLYHRAYVTSKVDDALLSGFLTAVLQLSEEISTRKIQVMDMQDTKFLYDSHSSLVYVLSLMKDADPAFGKEMLKRIISTVDDLLERRGIDLGVYDPANVEKLKTLDLDAQLDNLLNESIKEYYFTSPKKVLDSIQSFLEGIFGTLGKDFLDKGLSNIYKERKDFKMDYLKDLISSVEGVMSKSVNKSQASMIVKKLRDTFF
ncbi:MAG: hypothetical protein ACFFCS_21750 [Candidatus Hodarchaeota archaeon]